MKIKFFTLLGLGGLLTGCFDGNQSINEPEVSDAQDARPAIAARFDGATTHFWGYSEIQSNGGQGVQTFADCGVDQVMSGVGGRVRKLTLSPWSYVSGIDGVTVFCRSINSDGSLATQTSVVSGTPGTQSVVYADPNKVVVGVGGTVTGSTLTRTLILQCSWDASTRSVNPSSCSWKGSDNSTSGELFLDVHSRVGASERPKTIATGAGFSSTTSITTYDMSAIRLTMATLK